MNTSNTVREEAISACAVIGSAVHRKARTKGHARARTAPPFSRPARASRHSLRIAAGSAVTATVTAQPAAGRA